MPRISEFYGIAIYMYYRDHPPAHFHAIYGDYEALIGIDTLDVYKGWLPGRGMSLVLDWASRHGTQLQENWSRARARLPLLPIPPLD